MNKKSPAYKFDHNMLIPPMTRSGVTSETAAKLAAMTVGLSFLEPVEVAKTVKDPEERAKTFKETARKTSNSLSGAIRRFKKKNPEFDFVMRTVDDTVLGRGVRVWRVALEGKG